MTKNILFYLVAGVVIFMSGIYIGNKKGIKICSDMQYQHEDAAITDLQIKLKLLTNLREGKLLESKEMLEYLTDNDIQYLHTRLEDNDKEHNQQTEKEIKKVLIEAKKYRELYPEHKSDKNYPSSIDEILQNVGE